MALAPHFPGQSCHGPGPAGEETGSRPSRLFPVTTRGRWLRSLPRTVIDPVLLWRDHLLPKLFAVGRDGLLAQSPRVASLRVLAPGSRLLLGWRPRCQPADILAGGKPEAGGATPLHPCGWQGLAAGGLRLRAGWVPSGHSGGLPPPPTHQPPHSPTPTEGGEEDDPPGGAGLRFSTFRAREMSC